MTPQSGPWGTQVTIDGEHFGDSTPASVVEFAGAVGANGFVVDSWNQAEIRGRVAFPATGALSITTSAGRADVGTFATTETWMPSSPLDVAKNADLVVLSTGDVAGVYREYELAEMPTLAVFGGPAAGAYPLDGVPAPAAAEAAPAARIVEADDHTPLAIATRSDGSVATFSVAGGSLAVASTSLTGTVIAAGRDATGIYVWIDSAAGVVRARPGTPWTVDRGPIAAPQPPVSATIANDGTLWIAASEPGPGSTAYISLAMLAPAATSFAASERADPAGYPGTITQARVVVADDGVRAIVSATADPGNAPMPLAPRLRTATATWTAVPSVTGVVQYAFVGATVAAVVDDPGAKTTSLVPDVTAPSSVTEIPVWPAQSVGFAVDANAHAHPVVTLGELAYVLTPPP
jgi:hypothetical protein